jgi:L-fuculose-phosphate aldolase
MVVNEAVLSDVNIRRARERVAHIGRLLFARHLTDAAGGNLSERVGDLICISPRYSGSQRQWQLSADDVLVINFAGEVLAGDGTISRESQVHLRLHQEFGEYGTGVIHAHARNLLVFAAAEQPLPPVLEATRKFGVTPVVPYAPAHSKTLAANIAASMKGREHLIRGHAAGTIAPWHGLFLMGKDLYAAFDAVERLDNNAYVILQSRALGASPMMEAERARMEDAISSFSE